MRFFTHSEPGGHLNNEDAIGILRLADDPVTVICAPWRLLVMSQSNDFLATKRHKKLKWVLLIFEPFVPFCG